MCFFIHFLEVLVELILFISLSIYLIISLLILLIITILSTLGVLSNYWYIFLRLNLDTYALFCSCCCCFAFILPPYNLLLSTFIAWSIRTACARWILANTTLFGLRLLLLFLLFRSRFLISIKYINMLLWLNSCFFNIQILDDQFISLILLIRQLLVSLWANLNMPKLFLELIH